jgi:hypothetical protein
MSDANITIVTRSKTAIPASKMMKDRSKNGRRADLCGSDRTRTVNFPPGFDVFR